MPTVTTAVNPGSIDLVRDGIVNRFSITLDDSDPNRPRVVLHVSRLGGSNANPIQCYITDSGQRVAAEFPGCDPGVCNVDSSGHITAG
jgi:hypothetical protein